MELPDPLELARDMLAANPDAPANQDVIWVDVDKWEPSPVVDIEVESVEVRVVHTWIVTNASGARRRWSVAHDPISGDVLRDTWEGLPPVAPAEPGDR